MEPHSKCIFLWEIADPPAVAGKAQESHFLQFPLLLPFVAPVLPVCTGTDVKCF